MIETETPTPTATPTETATSTPTATPTETPTPTPNLYVEVTTEAGEYARISREISVADYGIILVLIAILISMWVMYWLTQLKERG